MGNTLTELDAKKLGLLVDKGWNQVSERCCLARGDFKALYLKN